VTVPKPAAPAATSLPDATQIKLHKIAPQSSLIQFLQQFTGSVGKAFDDTISKNEPQDAILMRSDAGHIWKVTMSDTGALVITQLYQQT